jgi:hypothetical protein
MQISSQKLPSDRSAFALLVTIVFLAVTLTIFASIFYWSGSSAKQTLRNNQYNMSQAAAEAATEDVLAWMMNDFNGHSLDTNINRYACMPGTNIDQSTWPVQYQFSDTNGNVGRISVTVGPVSGSLVPLNSQYGGLQGYAQPILLVARATPLNQVQTVTATVDESLQAAYIPLFQFAIFYNVNMEIAPGGGMQVTGPVFCNQSIWEATGTFTTNVTAVGTNDFTQSLDPFADAYSKSPAATFLEPSQPSRSGNALTMPIGTNNDPATVLAILGPAPAAYATGTSAAYTTNGQVYPVNEADLIISNAPYGTNFGLLTPTDGTNLTITYQDGVNVPYLITLPPNYYIVLQTNVSTGLVTTYTTNYVSSTVYAQANICVQYAGYTFATNTAFWDYRESKTVQAVEIDVSKLDYWLTNTTDSNNASYYDTLCQHDKAHYIDGIYVYNNVPETGTTLPAVRMVNGQMLPYKDGVPAGLTVVTPFPLYVKGDYNVRQTASGPCDAGLNKTVDTYPAALLADSVTILSSNWSDSYNASTLLTARNPVTTTINAGMLEGIVPSNPAISGSYSGGVENFMRLEENWSGSSPLWYNGAIVVLFYSQYATNSWQAPGAYYQVPTREWAFDTNFTQQVKIPPLTPEVKAIIRGQWTATAQ